MEMKRILSLAIAVAAIAIAISGCSKNNYGKWETRVLLSWSQGIDENRLDNLKACISEVEYFKEPRQYEGYRDDVVTKALNEFGDACNLIDKDKIDENLYFGEVLTLTLTLSAPGSAEGEMIGQVRIIGDTAPEDQEVDN